MRNNIIDYMQLWNARKKQLIILNIVFAIIGIGVAISDKNIGEGLAYWILGVWTVGVVLSMFPKNRDRVSNWVFDVLLGAFFGGATAATGGSILGAALYFWYGCKAVIGLIILGFVILYEYIAFPITSVYYFIKSKEY